MTDTLASFQADVVRNVRGGKILRKLNKVLPLGRKYNPLVRALNGPHGMLAVPLDKYRLARPALWAKPITNHLLFGPPPEFELLRPLFPQLRQGFLIDAGANIGSYTLFFRAVSNLPIIAYEPQPFLFKILQLNIAHNHLPEVEARNIACGAAPGNVAFWMGLNGSVLPEASPAARAPRHSSTPTDANWEQEAQIAQEGGTVINVSMTTLDSDLADIFSIALLKIDCEGFEYEILQGARELLNRHRPILFVEVHPHTLKQFDHSTRDVLDLLSPHYDLEFWYYRLGRHSSKLARSLAKFRRQKAHRCADASEMLAVAANVPGPTQIYFLGRPKGAEAWN